MSRRTNLRCFAPATADALGEWGRTAPPHAFNAAWMQLHALASLARQVKRLRGEIVALDYSAFDPLIRALDRVEVEAARSEGEGGTKP